MEKGKIKCGDCGKINERVLKPKPRNGREAKLIYFLCDYCGAKNLRDGTISGKKVNKVPKESLVEKENVVEETQEELPKEDVMEVEAVSKEVIEEEEESPTYFW